MKPFPLLTTALLLALTLLPAQSADLESTTPVPAKTNGEAWWNGNCQRIDTDIKNLQGNVDIAFVGDSITARWRGTESWTKHWGSYRSLNMGIGGDQTQHALWRLTNGDLEGYQAKLFVVMIGTNNLWQNNSNPEHAAAGIKAIINLIQSKQPQAKILLISLLPVGEKPNPGREKRSAVNQLISKLASQTVEYIDIYQKYLQPDGSISPDHMHDFLHLAPKGYDIWADAISPRVKEIINPQ
jgi:lysophospholipase L1-like esterase